MTVEVPKPPLKDRKALVVGVANEHSIAWGCAKAFHERVRRDYEAKVAALQDQAAKQKGEAKAAIDARIARLRQDYDRRVQAQVEAYGGDV